MTAEKSGRSIAEWFEEGRRCFHRPDGVGAVRALERVIELDPAYRHPDGDNPYFYLGKIDEMEDRLDAAIGRYTCSLAINPLDEESLIGRGSCYTVLRKHELAVADFIKVLRIPDNRRRAARKDLLYAVAENYRRMKDRRQALHWARQALAADPENYRHQQLLKEIADEPDTEPRPVQPHRD